VAFYEGKTMGETEEKRVDLTLENNEDQHTLEKKEELNSVEEQIVTLTLDDGEELECDVLTIFTAQEQEYIALTPTKEADMSEERSLFFFRYREMENTEPEISNIETDEEHKAVMETFEELFGIDDVS
jgi:uncharacterized protein YrzB (UPF0473 family)